MMGHVRGKAIADKLQLAIQEAQIPLIIILILGSDGTKVSKTVWTVFNLDRPGLLDKGNYSLHKCHNTFAVGVMEYGNDITNLMIDLNQWFELSVAR